MDELIAKAKKFLEENPSFNEIGLVDGFCNRVRIVRNSPVVWQTQPLTGGPWIYTFTYPGVK